MSRRGSSPLTIFAEGNWRRNFWIWATPLLFFVGAIVLALITLQWDVAVATGELVLPRWAVGSDPGDAQSILWVIAGASISALNCVSRSIVYTVNMRQKRAYRYRCYPTSPQAAVLARTFGCARFVYNWALRLRTDAYYERQERVSYADTSAALTSLKQQPDTIWLNDISSVPTQQALRHLDKAFRNFFEGRTKYPRFHKKHGAQSAEYTTSAFRWDAEERTLTLAKIDSPCTSTGRGHCPMV